MQLIVVIALLLMFGGKTGANRPQISGAEMAEIFKYISGDNGEMNKIIEEVEHVSEIINTLAPVVSAFGGVKADSTPFDGNDSQSSDNEIKIHGNGATPFDGSDSQSSDNEIKIHGSGATPPPLRPIVNIADSSIYNALSHAI